MTVAYVVLHLDNSPTMISRQASTNTKPSYRSWLSALSHEKLCLHTLPGHETHLSRDHLDAFGIQVGIQPRRCHLITETAIQTGKLLRRTPPPIAVHATHCAVSLTLLAARHHYSRCVLLSPPRSSPVERDSQHDESTPARQPSCSALAGTTALAGWPQPCLYMQNGGYIRRRCARMRTLALLLLCSSPPQVVL